MDSHPSQLKSQATESSQRTNTESPGQAGEVRLELAASDSAGPQCGYSLLIRGDIQPGSVLSSTESDGTITLLEDDAKLVSGELANGTVEFSLDGEVVAAAFDEPTPTVKLGGASVDPAQWPAVTEYAGSGLGQDPVEDPFPGGGELGGARDDPLNPEEYVIELSASEIADPEAYCFDIDGDVLECAGGPTVSESGDKVYGYLRAGNSAQITIQGHITRIDTANGIEFTVGAR